MLSRLGGAWKILRLHHGARRSEGVLQGGMAGGARGAIVRYSAYFAKISMNLRLTAGDSAVSEFLQVLVRLECSA